MERKDVDARIKELEQQLSVLEVEKRATNDKIRKLLDKINADRDAKQCCGHCPSLVTEEGFANDWPCNCGDDHTTCDPTKQSIDDYCVQNGYSCKRGVYRCASNYACAGFCNRI